MARSSGDSSLPTVEKTPAPPAASGLHPSLFILNWILFSNATILFNKWLLDTAGFRYPIILTCWHLIFATGATQILARTTSLLESRKSLPINGRMYIRTIVPIGILYTGSLVFSNLVYLYLSVAFTQMLKAGSPVAVLFTSWAFGVAEPNLAKFINILVIVIGVAVASFGEINFSLIGFIYQMLGIIFEAVRLVMIQVMLTAEGMKMDPLVALYYYAPVCAFFNIFVALFTELPTFKYDDLVNTGFTMLFLNASVAFMLNIASVFLIGKTSGLVLTLTGILKAILLVAVSVVIWKTPITLLQAVGYGIALLGLSYYSLGYDGTLKVYNNSFAYISATFNSYGAVPGSRDGVRGGLLTRRYIVLGSAVLGLLFVLAVLYGWVNAVPTGVPTTSFGAN
ncbi:hypothetical protein ARSEF1564_001538 [Beauveria bassiana]